MGTSETQDVGTPRLAAPMDDFAGLSALEIARLVSDRVCSPVDVVESTLARIERLNPSVNAFAWIRRDKAIEDARASEKRLANEAPRLLEGVPFTAKDLAAVSDGPTNKGSRAFEGYHTGIDAEV